MTDRTHEEQREYFVISERTQDVGKIAQLVKCFLCRHEDPRIHIKTPVVLASACKPRAGEKLTGGILGDCLNGFHICVHTHAQKEYIQNSGMNWGGGL